mgnify:CR=1 FL=1|jgi:hypothetical protein
MPTLSHSQAHALGDLASVGATAGRIARINEQRAISASEKGLFDGSLKAIESVTPTPERVAKWIATINKVMEADGRYAIGHGHYAMRLALLECECRLDAEVHPDLDDLASLARGVA